MSNTYFKFKQFTIHQDKCAMKVCTDACIFGAWFANKNLSAETILDIGSGTGLLILMLAQKQSARIDGIEIDSTCLAQLRENISQSEWKERMKIYEGDVRSFQFNTKYDFIVSNPPFYENSLMSPTASSNLARHSSHLTLEELIICINVHLNVDGSFGVLLPYYRTEDFEALAKENKFYLVEKVLIKQSPNHKFFRSILYYSRSAQSKPSQKELVIQKESRQYTNEFVELLKDYYLYLQPD